MGGKKRPASEAKPRIRLTSRTEDYLASIDGRPEDWHAALTRREAIDGLVQSFPELDGAEVVMSHQDARWM